MSVLKLRNETIVAMPNAQSWLDSMLRFGGKGQMTEAIFLFSQLPNGSQRQRMVEAGIELKDYLGGNAFAVQVHGIKATLDADGLGVYFITAFRPSWKITALTESLQSNKPIAIIVATYPELDAALLAAKIKPLSGTIGASPLASQHFFEVTIPANKILELAGWHGVKSISSAAKDEALNFESTGATKTNIAHLPVAFGGYGLLGDSMTIGVGDNTSGLSHVDLRDRIINYNPVPYTNHGQHINGIVGGAGIVNPKGQGFAPHATLVDHLYNLVWARTGTMVQAHNMSVTNNSYAARVGDTTFSGIYDAYSQALDSVCLQYPSVLHVFAAGNDGSLNRPPYVNQFGNVTGSYQPAKNVLVVGQTDKRYIIGVNSSRGPVRDGRLKPEIVAIGTEVLSTTRGDNYLVSGGTSMACPQVAGAGGLVQQRYKQLHAGNIPGSDVVKALLMNGAMDIGNPGPDYTFGFGQMDLYRSLQMVDNNRIFMGAVNNGGQQTNSIVVPANTAQLKVMLYWHEAQASILSATQLINDLDLEMVDPANGTHLPLVLNPTPANVNDNATPGVDHLNNVEQVVIDNPPAGNYTARIKGTSIPGLAPNYVLVYDFIPAGVQLTYPTTGATVMTNDSLRIYWDASPDTRSFTLSFSDNNGSTWADISNNIPASQRYFVWYPTGISSGQCLMRLTRNGSSQTFTTGVFAVNPQPDLQLSAVQCPGYMSTHWSQVPGATSYRVLRKRGPYLQLETTVTDTVYTLRGLAYDSVYYLAVQPMFNAVPGYRSLAVKRQPNNGSCMGAISDGDLALEAIVAPVTGRVGTSTQLGIVNYIQALIHNLDDAAIGSYRISWQLNGGAWQSQIVATGIPAGGSLQYPVPFFQNLSAPGTYVLRVAVENLSAPDPVLQNDTVISVVRQLANPTMNLAAAFTEGFEDSPSFMALKDTLGFTPNQHWDYYNSNDTGRLRTFVNSDITITGNRSVSMDVVQYRNPPITNFLTGTFDLSSYQALSGDELRVEFDYKLHGNTHYPDSNKVWIRGSDAQPWALLYSYDTAAAPGQVLQSGSLSLNDVMLANGQNFSTSTQLRFGQRDSTVIALNDYGTGLTLDNIKLYRVQNDVALDGILRPTGTSCNSNTSPVVVRLHNGVAAAINNATISYQLDNGPIVTENAAPLPGKVYLNQTFSTLLSNISLGAHVLKVWVTAPGDTYHLNDTLTTLFRNMPLVAAFPYLENFENGSGYWYAEGRNNSWQYGTPATPNVGRAASGTKAWKTNLAGYYNDNELSYLYSPCFDISTLSAPMLSFSAVLDIENCGATLCDGAYVEYSTDNSASWHKLGAAGQGYEWYTDTAHQVWNQQGDTRWHVVSIPLPASTQPMRFRIVFASDPGTGVEGIGVDDIHVFNLDHPIYNGASFGPVTQSVSGNNMISFLQGNQLIAQVNPNGQNLASTAMNVYLHPTVDTASQQYYLQRSFMVNSANQRVDSITARFFVLDTEVKALVNATGCATCSKPKDVYRLGISKYDDSIQTNENGTLSDNVTGVWTYYPSNKIKWVPYDNGYYAEVQVPSFSEFWFNDGGPQGNLSLPNFGLGSNALLSVYPNPNTNGVLKLTWNAGLVKNIEIALTNLMGQQVFRASVPSFNGKNSASLNVGEVAKGMYFLHCTIGEKRYTEKIVFR